MAVVKTEIQQRTKAGRAYVVDGLQAVYLLVSNNGDETWYTAADTALNAWDKASAGSELYVGRTPNRMKLLRPY